MGSLSPHPLLPQRPLLRLLPLTPATDLELVNKGGSTGIDPQRPVESAPPLSEIEIPKDKGLKVGESDEGLMPAGTKSTFSGGELHTIESANTLNFLRILSESFKPNTINSPK